MGNIMICYLHNKHYGLLYKDRGQIEDTVLYHEERNIWNYNSFKIISILLYRGLIVYSTSVSRYWKHLLFQLLCSCILLYNNFIAYASKRFYIIVTK